LTILTLTTDFGLKDGFPAVLKGVIWGICPDAKIADITHEISPQNILEGAFALWRAYSFFPPKTVHIAVVDPGVGTQRRAFAAQMGEQFFVGPDNGIFTAIYEDVKRSDLPLQIVHLTVEKYWLPNVSHTFHGRDIFAPVGAYLANGVALTDLGPLIDDPVRLILPVPERSSMGWRAHVTGVDVFGNLSTDLRLSHLYGGRDPIFRLNGREVRGMVTSYGERRAGELVALVNSEDFIELAIVNGNAGKLLNAQVGDIVEVIQ
jgi:S-adenosyl-L-methionine hydrolase (adenosine-forming)